MVEDSVGSNDYNGDGSTEYPLLAALKDKVNWLRGALAPESPLFMQQNAIVGLQKEPFQDHGMIVRIATEYGRELYCRAVYESFKRVYGAFDYYKDLTLSLVLPRDDFVAIKINKDLRGNELRHATDMICSRPPSEMQQLKERYHAILEVQLEVDVENCTDGNHAELLLKYIRLASAPHGESDVRMLDLEEILSSLHKELKDIFESPQKAIMHTVLGLGEEHLSVVVGAYPVKYGRSLETDLAITQRGHFEHGLLTIMKCSVNRPKYFAEVLHKAMRDPNIHGMRDVSHIDRETIVMVLTTVAKRDMKMINEEYRQKSGSTLKDDVSLAFSDRQDCLDLILLHLNPNGPNTLQSCCIQD